MKEEKLRCLLVEPYELPKEIEIDNTLEEKQKLVGGYIECTYLPNDPNVVIICNEEGKINGMKLNRYIGHDIIAGPFLIVGDDYENGDFCLRFEPGEHVIEISSNDALYHKIEAVEGYTISEVEINYVEDFFEILDKYKVYKVIDDDVFKSILEKKSSYLYMVLHNKNLVGNYDMTIKECLLKDNKSAELLLDEYEVEHIGNHKCRFFPKSLTSSDKENILINYVNGDFPNLNYLRIIVNLQSTTELSISDKTKLSAKRKVEQQEKDFFDNNSGMEMATVVKFKKDLKNVVEFKLDGQNWDFTYDINWIKENIKDYSTLLNNFIYLFEYVDSQMRWTMVSKLSYMGIFERSIFMHSKRDYPTSAAFSRLNQLADIQMCGYYAQLQKLGVRVENLILWFFGTYLLKEFGIKNFNINIPSKDSNYLEKCRTLLPEIDSCLKQYNYYVEDGSIDPELVQISSTHTFFQRCKKPFEK